MDASAKSLSLFGLFASSFLSATALPGKFARYLALAEELGLLAR